MRRASRGTGDVMNSISPTSYASRADGAHNKCSIAAAGVAGPDAKLGGEVKGTG